MPAICVDRCVCFNRPFPELLKIAKKTGATTVQALQEETEFGLSCRICNPYVRRMLRTGQTAFTEILLEEDEPEPALAEALKRRAPSADG